MAMVVLVPLLSPCPSNDARETSLKAIQAMANRNQSDLGVHSVSISAVLDYYHRLTILNAGWFPGRPSTESGVSELSAVGYRKCDDVRRPYYDECTAIC